MFLGIPDATLAAIVTLCSGAIGWMYKEWKDSVDKKNEHLLKTNVRKDDRYDFADRLRMEIIRLQGLVDDAYKDLKTADIQIDTLRADNLKLESEIYDSKREILRLHNEIIYLEDKIDGLQKQAGNKPHGV